MAGEGVRMVVLKTLVLSLRAWFVTRAHLTVENLVLRQQLAVMTRSGKRPKLRPRDRVFWTWLIAWTARSRST